jgi:hypothetical protein
MPPGRVWIVTRRLDGRARREGGEASGKVQEGPEWTLLGPLCRAEPCVGPYTKELTTGRCSDRALLQMCSKDWHAVISMARIQASNMTQATANSGWTATERPLVYNAGAIGQPAMRKW